MRVATILALLLIATGIVSLLVPRESEGPEVRTAGPDDRVLGRIPEPRATLEERRTILGHVPEDHPFPALAAIPQPVLRATQPVTDDLERLRLLLRAKPEFLAFGVDFTRDALVELTSQAAAEIAQLTAVVDAYEKALSTWRATSPPATAATYADLAAAKERFEPRLFGDEARPCRILAYRYENGAHTPLVADPFREHELYVLHADMLAMSKLVHDRFTEALILIQARKR